MKTINKITIILILLLLSACTSMSINAKKYQFNATTLKTPIVLLNKILVNESILPEWYSIAPTPMDYLVGMNIIKRNGKDMIFLKSLKTKTITKGDVEQFKKIAKHSLNSLERKYKLKDENIKNTKGITEKLVIGYNSLYPTMEKHILNEVATGNERNYILTLNKKTEDQMSDKDRTKVRKLLNKWLKRREFFDATSLYNIEISEATVSLGKLSKKGDLNSLELNNLNAKTLKITLANLLDPMQKWAK